MLRPVFLGLVLIAALPGRAEAWRGELARVIGADLVVVHYARSPAQIRLVGLDIPPEMGRQARRLMARLTAGKKSARVLPVGSDRGLITARVFVGRTCLNDELVRAGLARWDWKAAPRDQRLAAAQAEARRASRGLWAREPRRPAPGEPCTSPPDPPCPADRTCKVDADCKILPRSRCGCPVCRPQEAWTVNRATLERWRRHRSAKRPCPPPTCLAIKCAPRAVCQQGQCRYSR